MGPFSTWMDRWRKAQHIQEEFWHAIAFDDVCGVMAAIGNGADVRGVCQSNEPDPPLIYSALRGNTKMAKVLIDAGADVNQAGMGRTTPLMVAAYNGYAQWEPSPP